MKLPLLLTGAMLSGLMAAGAAQAAGNLVTNGDFSAGNSGFTSQYAYVAPTSSDAAVPPGVYTVTGDPSSVHPYWVQLDASNNRLIVNGSTDSTPTIWQENNLSTVAGREYTFSASAANICCNAAYGSNENDPTQLLFQSSTDGFTTFQTLATLMTMPPGDAGKFQTVTADFTALGSTSFRIIDGLNGFSGNDIAIDDISVSALSGGPPAHPVTAAPEPGTWALMMIGVGMIGAMLGYRKRTPAERGAKFAALA